jgi:hypothetical protein
VFVSRLGRIEVYQPIPPADSVSPEGPHTHVLPKLLAHRRTHAATEPVPEGFVPCMHIYPPHPAKDVRGRTQPFDANRHQAFQTMFSIFGDPELVALKTRVTEAVIAGEEPSKITVTDSRFARASVRVALRQLSATHRSLPRLAAWMAFYETPSHTALDQEELTEVTH